MRITLEIWRQRDAKDEGRFVRYEVPDVNEHMSFLEMLDVLNERLNEKGEEPIAFDHDCREGICGSCGFMISGIAHGKMPATTVCQLHMRHFHDGDVLTLEPWRAKAFPVLRDLVKDKDPKVAGAAQEALAGIQGREADDAVLAMLAGTDPALKAVAMDLVSRRRMTSAIPALFSAVNGADEKGRILALRTAVQESQGASFNLVDFHHTVLSNGVLPRRRALVKLMLVAPKVEANGAGPSVKKIWLVPTATPAMFVATQRK